VRAVVFDVDGVLVHGFHARPELQRRWDENLLADLGVDPERFASEFIYDVFVKKVIVGQTGLVDALDRVLPGLGYRGSTLDFVTYWLSHDSHLNEPLLGIVRRLGEREDLKLYVATNQEHVRAHWLWHGLGLGEVFDDMFYSARVGATKPSPRFIDFVEDRIGRQAEPPLFFDDREDIVAAARARGWEAVLFAATSDCAGHPWVAERL
jgi:putative hydrolase of the HAD superfamily